MCAFFFASLIVRLLFENLTQLVLQQGNRSSSSACGSADVLEALGVNINLEPEVYMYIPPYTILLKKRF